MLAWRISASFAAISVVKATTIVAMIAYTADAMRKSLMRRHPDQGADNVMVESGVPKILVGPPY